MRENAPIDNWLPSGGAGSVKTRRSRSHRKAAGGGAQTTPVSLLARLSLVVALLCGGLGSAVPGTSHTARGHYGQYSMEVGSRGEASSFEGPHLMRRADKIDQFVEGSVGVSSTRRSPSSFDGNSKIPFENMQASDSRSNLFQWPRWESSTAPMTLISLNDTGAAVPKGKKEEECPKTPRKAHIECMKKKQGMIVCEPGCPSNCCCAGPRIRAATQNWVIWFRVQVLLTMQWLLTQQEALMNNDPDKEKKEKEAKKGADHTMRVVKKCLQWWLGPGTVSFILVVMAEFFGARCKCCRRKNKKKEDDDEFVISDDELKQIMEDPEAKQQYQISKYLQPKEVERLGGIENTVESSIAGFTRLTYLTTQFFSFGMFYLLVDPPVTESICCLGTSGRFMVLTRHPLMSAKTAMAVFRGTGTTMIGLLSFTAMSLMNIEKGMIDAAESGDPKLIDAAKKAGPLSDVLVGQVDMVMGGFFVFYWLVFYVILLRGVKPWGKREERNFYESKEASVGQYYRTGERGMIPCLMKPRRKGGLRIFFGPYPAADLFGHLARDQMCLQCLQPQVALPVESDSGYPEAGMGKAKTAEESAGAAQMLLAVLNLIIGMIGFVVFGIHCYNLVISMRSCPTSAVVKPCLDNTTWPDRSDCAAFAKTPWFQQFLIMNHYMLPTDVGKNALLNDVKPDLMRKWLDLNSTNETYHKLYQIAKQTCAQRRIDLLMNPNRTKESTNAEGSIPRFNAKNYWYVIENYGIDNASYWDNETFDCVQCTQLAFLAHTTDFEFVIEVIEVLMLFLQTYVAVLVLNMLNRKLKNCPMVDLVFETDPAARRGEQDIPALEKECLAMMGQAFFARYYYQGVPEHIKSIENNMRKTKKNPELDPDPWNYDEEAETFDQYKLYNPKDRRLFQVNKAILGILEGEETISAWGEVPRLTSKQCAIIFFGAFFLFIVPVALAGVYKKAYCAFEGVAASSIFLYLLDYFIFRRRPEAGIVLTTRRLFQITRRPQFNDIFGKTEPLVKLDIMIHNCCIFYGSMTMETYVPYLKRCTQTCKKNKKLWRSGRLIVQGREGIFSMWRDKGDMRNIFYSVSTCVYVPPMEGLEVDFGKGLLNAESQEKEDKPPDPTCSCWCCPYTAPLYGQKDVKLLDRFVFRLPGEEEVYGRRLAIRPASCGEICCGRGLRIDCSCCCCCLLDEVGTEFIISTHRTLVEQRVAQRYCRAFSCCKKVPNMRITFLAHSKASAYVALRPTKTWGMKNVRVDLVFKLLMSGAREYSAGLMLHQRPYLVLNKKQVQDGKKKIYEEHIAAMYDIITCSEAQIASSDESEYEDGVDDIDSDEIEFGASDGEGEKKKKNKKKKGKAKGKAKAKAKAKAKGDEGADNGDGKGDGKGKDGKGKDGKDGKGKDGKDGKGKGKDDADNKSDDDDPGHLARLGGHFSAGLGALGAAMGGGGADGGDQDGAEDGKGKDGKGKKGKKGKDGKDGKGKDGKGKDGKDGKGKDGKGKDGKGKDGKGKDGKGKGKGKA